MVKTKILETEYTVSINDLNDPMLNDKDGYCRIYGKKIVIRKPDYLVEGCDENNEKIKKTRFQEVLLHELIHAYCKECSVFYDENEQLVDWFAEKIPNIIESYVDIIGKLDEKDMK